jgi:hypothetical protein
VIHQAFFWLHNASDREALIAGLRALAEIPQVRSLRIAVPAATASRDVVDASFAVCETMEFASLADQAAYQEHPVHRAFVEGCGHLWSRVVVYDSEEV